MSTTTTTPTTTTTKDRGTFHFLVDIYMFLKQSVVWFNLENLSKHVDEYIKTKK